MRESSSVGFSYSPGSMTVLLGQTQEASVLGHIVMVGVGMSRMGMGGMGITAVVGGGGMRYPRICGIASVRGVQVAHLRWRRVGRMGRMGRMVN